MGIEPEAMERQVEDSFAFEGANAARVSAPANPLGSLQLFLSVPGIAILSIAFTCLVAALGVIWLVATGGRDGASEFFTQIQFNLPLRTQIGAAAITVVYVGLAISTLAVARIVGKNDWRTIIAWTAPAPARVIGLFIGALAYAAAVTFAITQATYRPLLISGPTDLLLLGTIIVNLCLLAPIAEEIFFRGWLYTALRDKLPFWPSYLMTAALFTAIHWNSSPSRILRVIPLALVLGLVRERKQSIKPTIMLHAVYNSIVVAITLAET